MADKPISGMPAITSMSGSDLVTVVRPGDPAGTKNKQITYANFIAEENIWDRTGTDVTLANAGDTVQMDSTGGLQFGASGQNIVEFSIDGTMAGDSDTAIPTEKATKTYVDGHSSNNMWTRTGTDITLTNAGDTVQFDATGGIQFGAGGQNIVEFSIDGTMVGDSDTAVPTEKAVKTYVDNAIVSENIWDRTGTDVSLHNAGDDLDLSTAGHIIYSVDSVQTLVASSTIPCDNSIVPISSASNIILTSNPQIAAGTAGQTITIVGASASYTQRLVEGNGLKLDNGQYFNIGENDSITFVYYNSLWIETSRVATA